jgi:hypothetical protein
MPELGHSSREIVEIHRFDNVTVDTQLVTLDNVPFFPR